jgi:hypothetical protein
LRGSAPGGLPQAWVSESPFKYKLENGVGTFKGTIAASKGGCVEDRAVKLYRQASGDTKELGADHTNGKGRFEIDLGAGSPKKGKYYAKIKEAKLGSSTCLARTSPSVRLSD